MYVKILFSYLQFVSLFSTHFGSVVQANRMFLAFYIIHVYICNTVQVLVKDLHKTKSCRSILDPHIRTFDRA